MDQNRRIGVLFMQSQEFFGADSQIHASIMRHLDRERFDVHCAIPADVGGQACAAATEVRRIPGVHFRPTNFGPSLDGGRAEVMRSAARRAVPALWSLIGLVRYVRRHRIRVIHCTEKPRDAVYGTIVAWLGGAKCVIHVHVRAETWIRSIVRRSMDRAAALIGVSEFVAGTICELGYDPAKVFAVLNGLEVDEWQDVERLVDVEAVRGEFGIPPHVPMIVSASRLYRYKGQHDLIAALPAVREHVPDVRLLVVGRDDPRAYSGEASYSSVLRAMRDELGLDDNVIFTGWRSDVPALMAASDLYAMPSFEEPFGMVFIESMFLRRPVVALDNGGTREVVDHEGSGLLSQPGDIGQLATNLVRLLEDPELRARMGEHGRRRVLEHLNSARMAADVEQVYLQILGAAG